MAFESKNFSGLLGNDSQKQMLAEQCLSNYMKNKNIDEGMSEADKQKYYIEQITKAITDLVAKNDLRSMTVDAVQDRVLFNQTDVHPDFKPKRPGRP